MIWDSHARKWDEAYARAEAYYNRHQDLNVPATYKCADGFVLGKWLNQQRKNHADGKLSDKRYDKLCTLGMVWDKGDSWKKSMNWHMLFS